jgi:hypothetical protein
MLPPAGQPLTSGASPLSQVLAKTGSLALAAARVRRRWSHLRRVGTVFHLSKLLLRHFHMLSSNPASIVVMGTILAREYAAACVRFRGPCRKQDFADHQEQSVVEAAGIDLQSAMEKEAC